MQLCHNIPRRPHLGDVSAPRRNAQRNKGTGPLVTQQPNPTYCFVEAFTMPKGTESAATHAAWGWRAPFGEPRGVQPGSRNLRMLLLFQEECGIGRGTPQRPQTSSSFRLRARLSAALPHAHSFSHCLPVLISAARRTAPPLEGEGGDGQQQAECCSPHHERAPTPGHPRTQPRRRERVGPGPTG